MDAHLCELVNIKNGVLFPFLYFLFLLFPVLIPFLWYFSDKVNVNREMTWRVHCLVFLLCYKVEPTRQLEDAMRQGKLSTR